MVLLLEGLASGEHRVPRPSPGRESFPFSGRAGPYAQHLPALHHPRARPVLSPPPSQRGRGLGRGDHAGGPHGQSQRPDRWAFPGPAETQEDHAHARKPTKP